LLRPGTGRIIFVQEASMATTPVLLSIDEYLRTSFHPDADFVDGAIEERNLGEYEHSKIQTLIAVIFTINQEAWHTNAVVEQRIRITENRVRVCDVAVLRADAPRESVTKTPPLICIEVMSPEDRLYRAKEVLSDYLAMGVQNIWLIDPIRRAAFTFDASGLHEADPTRLVVANSPIHLDLTQAFAAIE
jgi:Uma2 family endonuclease